MPQIRAKSDGSKATNDAPTVDATDKTIEHPNLDVVVTMLALATIDEVNALRVEINALRALGIIGLAPIATYTLQQWIDKIKAKA